MYKEEFSIFIWNDIFIITDKMLSFIYISGLTTEDDGLCPSMYSYHSSPEEKNKLLRSLIEYGIETTVDRSAKKDRIRAWIENSMIEEEEGDEAGNDSENEEKMGILDNETGPVGERMDRGPIQAARITTKQTKTPQDIQKRREKRDAMFMKRNSAIYKPPIDPRIPLEKQRFSRSESQLAYYEPQNIPKLEPIKPQQEEKPNEEEDNKYAPQDTYFEKFSSLANNVLTVNNKPDKSTQKSFFNRKDSTKTASSTQTSLSNGSNENSSDKSTLVNYEINNDDRQSIQRQNGGKHGGNTNGNGLQNVKQDNRRSSTSTQTNEHQNERVFTPKMINTADLRNGNRDDKMYVSKYEFNYSPMKGRYGMYDTREEKSSSSNSTGRSVSK